MPTPPVERCPKCRGWLFVERGDVQCINCGWLKPPDELLGRPTQDHMPHRGNAGEPRHRGKAL